MARRFVDLSIYLENDVVSDPSRMRRGSPTSIIARASRSSRAAFPAWHDDYVNAGCGMGYEATMYLLERGVRLTGTDA